MKIKLRPYQQDFYDKLMLSAKTNLRVLGQAETGFGKSVVIGYLANKLEGRTLILTHREEIFEQNSEWLTEAGFLRAKKNTATNKNKVVIAMAQTLHARIKKYGITYIGNFDNIILDEVHIQIFNKVLLQYTFKRLFGFTATPIINKNRTILIDGEEYTQQITFSETYDDIVCGATISELIKAGFLVQEKNIALVVPNMKKLKESSSTPDGYTSKSLDEVYNAKVSIDILIKSLNTYCKGKKTLIFNSTTNSNKKTYETLLGLGFNVRMFDSVNSHSYERKEVIDWFESQRDAVLVSTNVFTTGFNVPDIECVIMNRATKSLSFYIQMVGRGGRPTDKILKDNFTFIDLGGNIQRHDRWSTDRNWKDYFYPARPKLKKNYDLLDIWECFKCGEFNLVGTLLNENNEIVCNNCGQKKSHKKTYKKNINGKLVPLDDLPLPSAKKIIDYTTMISENSSFAFKLLEKRIIELFLWNEVSKEYYKDNIHRFKIRIIEIYRPVYFAIIKSNLGGKRRKLQTQLESILLKIDKMYQIDKK